MKVFGHLFGFTKASFILGGVFYWYQRLWMPRLEWLFLSQALPLGAVIAIITVITQSKSPVGRILFPASSVFFIASIVTQVLVWTSIINHPNF